MKDKDSIWKTMPSLEKAGYDPKNVNIIWVLTNYSISIKQNRDPERGRIVPDDIMLLTHEGAASTMLDFIKDGTPRAVDGGVYIILGGKKNTVLYTDKDGKPLRTGKNKDTFVVKDFKYLTLKEPGGRMTNDSGLKKQAFQWIKDNAPQTLNTAGIFDPKKNK